MKGDQDDIRMGPQTRERACRVLEQQLGAVWAAVLESHGYDPAAGYRVTLAGLAVEPTPGGVVARIGEDGQPRVAVPVPES